MRRVLNFLGITLLLAFIVSSAHFSYLYATSIGEKNDFADASVGRTEPYELKGNIRYVSSDTAYYLDIEKIVFPVSLILLILVSAANYYTDKASK